MKNLILVAALVAASTFSKAQDYRLTVGSKFAFGHSYFSPSSGAAAFHPSWGAGLSFEYLLGENLGAGVDILYSSEGATYKVVDITSTTDVDYLRIPLRIMYHFGDPNKDMRFRIFGGPTPGILFAENTLFKNMDFGADVGVGLSYRAADDFWITGDVDYYHGLMNVANAGGFYNRNIRFNLGLMFGF